MNEKNKNNKKKQNDRKLIVTVDRGMSSRSWRNKSRKSRLLPGSYSIAAKADRCPGASGAQSDAIGLEIFRRLQGRLGGGGGARFRPAGPIRWDRPGILLFGICPNGQDLLSH